MKFLKHMTGGLFSLSLLLSSQAFAIPMLNFSPDSQTVTLGNQTTVNVGISGLTNEYVGVYDFNVNWNSSLLSLDSVSFGTTLGGPGGSSSGIDDTTNGIVNIFEVSLGALINQSGNGKINLFSLTFNTLALGTSSLSFSAGIDPFFDFLGNDLGFALTPSLSNGSITITESTSIPEPSTMWLLGMGLMLMLLRNRFT